MDPAVMGTLRCWNGQPSLVRLDFSSTVRLMGQSRRARCQVADGAVDVSFSGGTWEGVTAEHLVAHGSALVHCYVLTRTVLDGYAQHLTIERIRLPDGEITRAPLYGDGELDSRGLTEADMARELGLHPYLLYAFGDFNRGLGEMEDCPMFMYRTVETAARYVLQDLTDRNTDWERAHALLGTSRADLQMLVKWSANHRHGNRAAFGGDEHRTMIRQAHAFLISVVIYLKNHPPAIMPPE